MALNINGTTGISGVDGSASAPALTGTDSNTGINFASDTVNINTGGTTRATVDSAGWLLIGTTTEGETGGDQLTVAGAGNTGITIRGGTTSDTNILFSDGTSGADEYRGIIRYQHNSNRFEFFTDATRRMLLRSDGNFCVGKESGFGNGGTPGIELNGASHYSMFVRTSSIPMYVGRNTNFGTLIALLNNGSEIGSISSNGSNASFNTSSDYRLKENVVEISDGITRLKTLKPSRFNFISNPSQTVDGFLAHEVTAVPEAITGTKDEVATEDDEQKGLKKGDPIYQGIDQSKLVPLLTAALQEAVAKIEVLETKVAALEAG